MMAPLKLQVFRATDCDVTEADPIASLEAQRLVDKLNYETAFGEGWAAAQAAHGEQAALSEELIANFTQLSITCCEAKAQALWSVKPLIEQICMSVLPEIARLSLRPTIETILARHIARLDEAPISIWVSADMRPEIECLLVGQSDLRLSTREDPSLEQGQIRIQFNDEEDLLDLGRVAVEILRAVEAFYVLKKGAP